MGQVPAFRNFLIIGNGRVARHFIHYFNLESIPYLHWHRKLADQDRETELQHLVENASHVLLLISDSAIESFVQGRPYLASRDLIHFSGALVTPLARGVHPLMTFADHLYDLETYRRIPMVYEKREFLGARLPRLQNTGYDLESARKPLYHALCVLAGNFSVMLWEKAFSDFQNHLGLPREVLEPYLEQTTANLLSAETSVLTGPLPRADHSTIERNLQALAGDPFAEVYRAFVAAYFARPENQERNLHENRT